MTTDDYEIEPWQIRGIGVSPGAPTGVPGKQFSIPRPYIPYGTGYNALRSRPGVAELKKQLSGVGRTEYTPRTVVGRQVASDYTMVKPPKDFLNLNADGSPIGEAHARRVLENEFRNNLDKKFNLNYKHKVGVEQYVPAAKEFGTKRGLYSPGTHSIIYPHDDPGNTKRHELQHAIQQRRMTGGKPTKIVRGPTWDVPHMKLFEAGKTMSTNAKEIEANIVQNKSIRKGYERFAEGQKYYDTPEEQKNKIRKTSKILNSIPGKPGMMTGRLPSLRGIGGGVIDMFMEGPELQKAKYDPNYGLPEERRKLLEHAYQYGI